ncbi:hypothetical protein EJ110_NYTH39663 [Nymphaea thermarum]|nr:hypothetical protein EJ110_NYTH39663 [Nymphaea thermarum]
MDGSSLQSDKNVLIDLKQFLQRNNAVHQGKYDQWTEADALPCGWSGIVCTGCRVIGIDLSNSMPQTQGMLYPHFPSLTALGSLDLSGNTFSRSILADLGQCASLDYLNLSHNILEWGGGGDPDRQNYGRRITVPLMNKEMSDMEMVRKETSHFLNPQRLVYFVNLPVRNLIKDVGQGVRDIADSSVG